MNLIDAISTNTSANSPVALSSSSVFNRQYGSLHEAVPEDFWILTWPFSPCPLFFSFHLGQGILSRLRAAAHDIVSDIIRIVCFPGNLRLSGWRCWFPSILTPVSSQWIKSDAVNWSFTHFWKGSRRSKASWLKLWIDPALTGICIWSEKWSSIRL